MPDAGAEMSMLNPRSQVKVRGHGDSPGKPFRSTIDIKLAKTMIRVSLVETSNENRHGHIVCHMSQSICDRIQLYTYMIDDE